MTGATTQLVELLLCEPSQSTVGLLCLLYGCLTAHALYALPPLRRLLRPRTHVEQIVGSLALASALRLLSFASFLAIMAASAARASHGENCYRRVPSSEQAFYAKGVVLMFNLPDFVVVSSYALLLVVWFEGFLDARRHWWDRRWYAWNWRVAYLCFNALLFASQLVLYALVFFAPFDGVEVLYFFLAAVTLVMPVIHVAVYVALTFKFAGFPPVGDARAKNARARVSRVALAWGLGRSCWGAAVYAAVFVADGPRFLRDPSRGTVAVVGLFLLTEICPFVLALDSGFLRLVEKSAGDTGYGSVATPPRVAETRPDDDPRKSEWSND